MAVKQLAYEVDGWGIGELWRENGRVVWHELPHPSRSARTLGTDELVERLQGYFAGDDISFDDVPVDLEHETQFLESCARALREIPRGEVVTYGELAALAGRPRAARAAGTFCARCDLAPFLPVHRVVSVGGLGSWGAQGNDYKRRLLELEGVTF
jgi:methylated-DNA-[protein]-cysteine S-methyltransferase